MVSLRKIINFFKRKRFFYVTLIFFLIITLVIILPIKNVDLSDFLYQFLFAYLGICSLLISLELEGKSLSIGWLIFSCSFLIDSMDEITQLGLLEWQDLFAYRLSMILAFVFVVFGAYEILLQKEYYLQRVKNNALKDPLTNLYNRRILTEYFLKEINKAHLNGEKLAVLFIDFDKFTLVNNTFGHAFGDELLKKVADRLRVAVEEQLIARLSGNEFIIILNRNGYINNIEQIVTRIQNALKYPFVLYEQEIHITSSIGISIYPDDGKDVDTLLKNADLAVHKAKLSGGNTFLYFTQKMKEESKKRLLIQENLRKALLQKEFILHYQPKIDIQTGNVSGFEALVRWQRSDGTLIYPNQFIEIAEESGIMKEIDIQVFELACLQIRKWMDEGKEPFNIAVNFSANLLNTFNFVEKIESILHRTEIDTSYLSIEITETQGIEDIEHLSEILTQLKAKKININLDDFGTGYSSLYYLRTLPVDTLKIDKSFIDGIANNKKDKSLIKAAIMMSKDLGIKVISEGVESVEQYLILRQLGCDECQGYLFSPPRPIDEAINMISSWGISHKAT